MPNKPNLDGALGLLLMLAFAAFLFLTLAYGARVYRQVSQVLDQQYGSRTAVAYVAAKVHGADTGGISLTSLEGAPALLLTEEIAGQTYHTYLYCWQDAIRELYCPAGTDLGPEAGQAVVTAQALDFSLQEGLLRISCRTAGGLSVQYVQVAAGGGS